MLILNIDGLSQIVEFEFVLRTVMAECWWIYNDIALFFFLSLMEQLYLFKYLLDRFIYTVFTVYRLILFREFETQSESKPDFVKSVVENYFGIDYVEQFVIEIDRKV